MHFRPKNFPKMPFGKWFIFSKDYCLAFGTAPEHNENSVIHWKTLKRLQEKRNVTASSCFHRDSRDPLLPIFLVSTIVNVFQTHKDRIPDRKIRIGCQVR